MRSVLQTLEAAIAWAVGVAFAAACAAMLAIMVIGTADVIGSFLLRSPLPAALELQEVLLGILIFLGLGQAQKLREHIDVDIVTTKLGPSLRRRFELLVLVVGVLSFAVIAWRAWVLAMASWKVGETANAILTFPIYPAKFLVAFGAAVAALECIRQIGRWFVRSNAEQNGKG